MIVMIKQIIKTIIAEKQREISQVNLIERPIEFEGTANYVLIGIRRACKSYQMYQDIKLRLKSGEFKPEDILFINFEDERIASLDASQLGLILECYAEMFDNPKPHIYLDEIQNIDGWEKFVRRLADSKYRIMVTGSNAKMLSREISTTLGGRFIIREIYPFSFSEYLKWNNLEINKNSLYDTEIKHSILRLFEPYFHFGGFAETFSLSNKREWINSLYLKILVGDIIARNNIRNGNAMRILAKKLAESVMQPTSQTRLLNIVKSSGNDIGRNSIAEYLNYMNEAYLTFNVSNFTDALAEKATSCKRYYLDNGLLNNFLFEGKAQLLENLIAIDLIKHYRNGENDGVYFYNKGVEVDFYVPDAELAIQVSYSIEDLTTRERETRALVKLAQTFNIKRAVIITRDEEAVIKTDGLTIEVIPAWKWLLRFTQ